jgi:hypothetical protein
VDVPTENSLETPIETTVMEKRMYNTTYQFTKYKSTPRNIKDGAILSIITRIINLESL